jgi:hypothetical protein
MHADTALKNNGKNLIKTAAVLAKKKNEKDKIKKEKKMKENLIIPSYNEYAKLKQGNNNYTLIELKEICRFYKQKLTGKKEQLAENLYNYLYTSKYAIIIQKKWRTYFINVYNKLRGPARMKRTLCVNETDFYTMEPLQNISYLQFFSYCDEDKRKKNNVVYGFDILSLFMLMKNEYGQTDEELLKNPYTREPFPDKIKEALFKLIKVSKRFHDQIISKVEEPKPAPIMPMINVRENIITRSTDLFNDINDLGNYTLPSWFLNLGHTQMIRFIHEIYDIWTYRANLSDSVKREICPPYGNPFMTTILATQMLSTFPVDSLKLLILDVMEQFVGEGINRDSRYLGTNLILCALTLVSPEAAEAMPWLYESVSYNNNNL